MLVSAFSLSIVSKGVGQVMLEVLDCCGVVRGQRNLVPVSSMSLYPVAVSLVDWCVMWFVLLLNVDVLGLAGGRVCLSDNAPAPFYHVVSMLHQLFHNVALSGESPINEYKLYDFFMECKRLK